jgi:hypothetical protein
VKHSSDPTKWTNQKISEDSEGYVAAQQAYRKAREEEQRKALEDFDRQTFVSEFVRRGGTREDAERAYTNAINREAAEAAEAANTEAAAYQRRRVRSVL